MTRNDPTTQTNETAPGPAISDAAVEAAAFSLFRDERTARENDRFPPPEAMFRDAWQEMAGPEWGMYSTRAVCLRRAERALAAALPHLTVPPPPPASKGPARTVLAPDGISNIAPLPLPTAPESELDVFARWFENDPPEHLALIQYREDGFQLGERAMPAVVAQFRAYMGQPETRPASDPRIMNPLICPECHEWWTADDIAGLDEDGRGICSICGTNVRREGGDGDLVMDLDDEEDAGARAVSDVTITGAMVEAGCRKHQEWQHAGVEPSGGYPPIHPGDRHYMTTILRAALATRPAPAHPEPEPTITDTMVEAAAREGFEDAAEVRQIAGRWFWDEIRNEASWQDIVMVWRNRSRVMLKAALPASTLSQALAAPTLDSVLAEIEAMG